MRNYRIYWDLVETPTWHKQITRYGSVPRPSDLAVFYYRQVVRPVLPKRPCFASQSLAFPPALGPQLAGGLRPPDPLLLFFFLLLCVHSYCFVLYFSIFWLSHVNMESKVLEKHYIYVHSWSTHGSWVSAAGLHPFVLTDSWVSAVGLHSFVLCEVSQLMGVGHWLMLVGHQPPLMHRPTASMSQLQYHFQYQPDLSDSCLQTPFLSSKPFSTLRNNNYTPHTWH